jgi:hypothetical protein
LLLRCFVGMWGLGSSCGDDCFVGLFLLGFLGGSAIIIVPIIVLSVTAMHRAQVKMDHVLERRFPEVFCDAARPARRTGGAQAATNRASLQSSSANGVRAAPVMIPAPSAPPLDDVDAPPPYEEAAMSSQLHRRAADRSHARDSLRSSARARARAKERLLLQSSDGTESARPPTLRRTSSRGSRRGDSTIECVICMDAERSVLFLPCRHITCCTDCARHLHACPVCRQTIDDRLEVAIS